jgi:catechol 2,3-dioxygenase-like lactoylglutathione lyase family enzyme
VKRLHVHIAVDDIERAIGFYSALFGSRPSVVKPDYAKWMLDNPGGVRWETFLSFGETTTYGEDLRADDFPKSASTAAGAACCS